MGVVTLMVDGWPLDGTADGVAPVLGALNLTWGVSRQGEQAPPSTLTFSVLVKTTMQDVPYLVDGAPVTVQWAPQNGQPNRRVFTGRIRRMQAKADDKGRLNILVTCADFLSDFTGVFTSADLSAGNGPWRGQALQQLFTANSVALGLYTPADLGNVTRARQKVQSIKLQTLLERYLAPGHFSYVDITDRDVPIYTAEIGIVPRAPRVMTATAKLRARPTGEWYMTANSPPALLGYSSLSLDARQVIRDVEWTMETTGITTRVGWNYPRLSAETGFTEMQAGGAVQSSAASLEKYGVRSVEVDTDLDLTVGSPWPPLVLETFQEAWLDDNPLWEPTAVTIRDVEDAPINWDVLLGLTTRYKTWVEIWGIHPNRPNPGPDFINAPAIGGELRYDGKKWSVTVALGKAAAPLAAAVEDQYRAMDIGLTIDPLIWQATIGSVGDQITFDNFNYISKG